MTGKNEGTPHAVTIRRIGTRRRFWWGLVLGSTLLMGCHSGLQSAEQPRETVEISILTPDAGWQLRVREVRETADAVWVWADLQRPSGPAAQQLTTVSTRVDLPSGKERQVFVTGKTWRWENEEPYQFVDRAPNWPADATPVAPTQRDEKDE